MDSFLADLVMLLHFSFILFVVFGGLLALRWLGFAAVHLPTVVWALFLELQPGTLCPLTPLEQMLRHRAREPSYTGGFIAHYLGPIIYPNMTLQDQYFIAAALFLLTLVIYWRVYRRWRRARK
jgi:hypothetical protein